MNASPSTPDLVRRAQAGDNRAFGALVERYRQRVQALIHVRLSRRLRQRIAVEDIEQETYVRAFGSLSRFQWRSDGSFFHWLGGIVEHVIKNQVRYHLETQKRMAGGEVSLGRPLSGEKFALVASGPSPSDALRREDRLERLERALDALSEEHREVIILARLRSLPLDEIAKRMDRSVDAVSMLLLRALRKLKSAFGDTDSLHLPPRSLDRPSGGGGWSDSSGSGCDMKAVGSFQKVFRA